MTKKKKWIVLVGATVFMGVCFFVVRGDGLSQLHLGDARVVASQGLSCRVAKGWTQSVSPDRITQQPLMRCAPFVKIAGPFKSIASIEPRISLVVPGKTSSTLHCSQVDRIRTEVTHLIEYSGKFFLIQYAYDGTSSEPPKSYEKWRDSVQFDGAVLLATMNPTGAEDVTEGDD